MKTAKWFCAFLALFFAALALVPSARLAFAHAEVCETSSSAVAMALVDGDSGELVYVKNGDKKMYPASTTKICTAITVLEHWTNLDLPVAIPDKAVGVEGSSLYLMHGEMLSVRDLLYGLMLQSGNDCATALAIIVGDSVDGFVKLMNETAERAGASNTHFANPHGLHDPDHYTTAKDLCAISYYAMKNETFRDIVSTKRHKTTYKDHDYGRNFPNKNKILFNYDGGNGIKTGFTKAAGRCLVSSATRDGKTYICTVLNCGNMFEECMRLMDMAFER